MKKHLRVLGFDDGPFTFEQKKVPVTGVLIRLPNYIEAMTYTLVEVDGTDATDRLIEVLSRPPFAGGEMVVMTDGVAFGGFNVIDGEKIWRETGHPVITVATEKPDMAAIKKALKKRFRDWEDRYRVIEKSHPMPVIVEEGPGRKYTVYIATWGMDTDEARGLVRKATLLGKTPEPIRIAHMVSKTIAAATATATDCHI